MKNIIWYNLNEKGFREGYNKPLIFFFIEKKKRRESPGIYAYMLKSDISKLYIGSAINIAQRFRQHRYRCSIYKSNNSKLYNLIIKHWWESIEFGIIEKVDF